MVFRESLCYDNCSFRNLVKEIVFVITNVVYNVMFYFSKTAHNLTFHPHDLLGRMELELDNDVFKNTLVLCSSMKIHVISFSGDSETVSPRFLK